MDNTSYQVLPYWQPDGVQKYIAGSVHNYVGLLNDGQTALKYTVRRTPEELQALRDEGERYARVGPHQNLVTFRGLHPYGLLLEYCAGGGLEDILEGPTILPDEKKTTIGKEIVRCLVHLHQQNFIHADIHVRNVFLTSDMVAKVGDLQGQLYRPDGSIESESMVQESPKSRHPHAGPDEFSQRTDIFALGTLLYHLWRGHAPFPELNDIDNLSGERYRAAQYPVDLSQTTGIDSIIGKCWTSRYECASEVLDDMDKLDGREVG